MRYTPGHSGSCRKKSRPSRSTSGCGSGKRSCCAVGTVTIEHERKGQEKSRMLRGFWPRQIRRPDRSSPRAAVVRLEVNETGLQTLGFLQDVVQAGAPGSTVANSGIYFPRGGGGSTILPRG